MKVSLRLKMILASVSVAALIASVSIFISYRTYSRTIDDYYKDTVTNIAGMTASMMDADKMNQYYETREKDADYEKYLDILYTIKQNNEIKYLYIEKIVGTNAVAIMDADTSGKSMALGDTFAISDGADVSALENGIPAFISNEEGVGWVCSVFVPIKDKAGNVAALVGADISMDEVMAQRYHFLVIVCIAIMVSTIAAIIVLLILLQRFVVTPINLLSRAAESFVCKEEEPLHKEDSAISRLEITTKDEIELLSDSIKQMEKDIYGYIDNLKTVTAEKERIGAELDVAARIQADMLPCIFPAFPERHEFDIYATMTPAKEVGGDFYDFFLVDDDHLAMVMADVSGKGVPAALFMMISKTLLKSAAQTGLSPKAVLEKVNNQLCENNEAEMFVTVWLGILEISTGKMLCANAGHEYPAIRRRDGSFELLKDRHGLVLAGMENVRYKEYELTLTAGDSIFVYTDGVTEATNAQNELFGTERMIRSLNHRAEISCEELLHQVHQGIEVFVGDAPQFDDITMMCLTLNQNETDHLKKKAILPKIGNLGKVTAFIEEEMDAADVPMKVLSQVNIAVDEIFSNIAQYSGASASTVGCQITGTHMVIRFSDNGRPYDPTQTPDPDTSLSAEERDTGGLGIYMVKKMMDKVTYDYSDGFNILTLEKDW